jgi:hypothetical protein
MVAIAATLAQARRRQIDVISAGFGIVVSSLSGFGAGLTCCQLPGGSGVKAGAKRQGGIPERTK